MVYVFLRISFVSLTNVFYLPSLIPVLCSAAGNLWELHEPHIMTDSAARHLPNRTILSFNHITTIKIILYRILCIYHLHLHHHFTRVSANAAILVLDSLSEL